MKYELLKIGIAAILLTNSNINVLSQQSVRILPADSKIIITGTSNLHDWEEKVVKFDIAVAIKFEKNEIVGFDQVHFNCKSESITSDHAIMTGKTMEAIRAEEYPDIVFNMVVIDKLNSVDSKFSGALTGDLKLAGVTKRISVAFTGSYENNRIIINARKVLNLSEFKITPPTALMGTLKTGENVVVSFQLQFLVS
jgi:polyisoprenoid-binding protein YceI